MNKHIAASLLLGYCTAVAAQAGPAAQCPYTPEVLSKHFGQPFKAGVPEAGLLGKGCTYDSKAGKLWLDMGPNPAPTAEAYRKMANPPGTTWKPVPGDPDKAVHTIAKVDVSPFPSLFYERKGQLVSITVTGVSGKGAIDAWNAKLVTLPRLP